eukprot:gene38448-46729_t
MSFSSPPVLPLPVDYGTASRLATCGANQLSGLLTAVRLLSAKSAWIYGRHCFFHGGARELSPGDSGAASLISADSEGVFVVDGQKIVHALEYEVVSACSSERVSRDVRVRPII